MTTGNLAIDTSLKTRVTICPGQTSVSEESLASSPVQAVWYKSPGLESGRKVGRHGATGRTKVGGLEQAPLLPHVAHPCSHTEQCLPATCLVYHTALPLCWTLTQDF